MLAGAAHQKPLGCAETIKLRVTPITRGKSGPPKRPAHTTRTCSFPRCRSKKKWLRMQCRWNRSRLDRFRPRAPETSSVAEFEPKLSETVTILADIGPDLAERPKIGRASQFWSVSAKFGGARLTSGRRQAEVGRPYCMRNAGSVGKDWPGVNQNFPTEAGEMFPAGPVLHSRASEHRRLQGLGLMTSVRPGTTCFDCVRVGRNRPKSSKLARNWYLSHQRWPSSPEVGRCRPNLSKPGLNWTNYPKISRTRTMCCFPCSS